MQENQLQKSSCDSSLSACMKSNCAKAIVVDQEDVGSETFKMGTGNGNPQDIGVGGGGGGTSFVSNSPLTSSSGGSVHEAQPTHLAAPVTAAPLGLLVSGLNETLDREQAQVYHTGSKELEIHTPAPAAPPPPRLHPVAGDPTGAAGTAFSPRSTRIMRLDPAANALPPSSGPVVEPRHTLRLHTSAAASQPRSEMQRVLINCSEEEDAPPSKRLRSSLDKPSPSASTPSTATTPKAPTTTVGGDSDGGRRVLQLSLPIRSPAPTGTVSNKDPTAMPPTSPGGGLGDDADVADTHASEESENPTNAQEKMLRKPNTPGDYTVAAGSPPPPENAAFRPPPIFAGATSRAVPDNASIEDSAVMQQQLNRPTASNVNPSCPTGVGIFPRLRSLTPTPYPGGQGSPCRRHRFAGVNLPSAPPPSIDYGSIQRTAKEVYEVHEKLSEGTYGEVFKGVDKRTGAAVALKRLKMLSTHQGFPQTSLREVIALRHIQIQRERLEEKLSKDASHRGSEVVTDPLAEVSQLCDVLIYDRQQRDIVLVFPYATASLAGLCRRQFAFTPSEMAYLMKKIMVAVRKLHEMRIIHRDIKSDNVLVTSDGEVQLTDFGLCSISSFGTSRSGGQVWRTPSVITLAYRPPEMLLGSTAYDDKVDIWSVGCLLAQMYLLEPPFYKHRTHAQQQQQQRTSERTAATELEQLSRITEILGPLPPVRVYHPDSCQHMRLLEQLEMQGRQAESGRAAQPANWGKLQTIFEPSFLYQQFHGFRGWFEAELQRSRHQLHRRPTQACMDVLCATLQLDPQQRPTAAELLRMPYFTTLDDAPLLGSYQRLLPITPEREAEVRRGFMIKVQRGGDSHTQRAPHK